MIPFNKPFITGDEIKFISDAHKRGQLAGDGFYTRSCCEWLERELSTSKVLLTHSCTAALEMAALLCEFAAGDEVIMPSYTFVSSANAFVLRGATPVFVDIREDTLNIDENLIEAAITPKTKAILVVHYAGVACEMDYIMALVRKYNLYLIEDAAQAIFSTYKGKALGTIGDLGCFSFHETKNINSGEGGALLVNNPNMVSRAEIIREKGTDRTRFFRGEVDKYTWVDLGSSFLPGEIVAAFLWAQLQHAHSITERRLDIWNKYADYFRNEKTIGVTVPSIPAHVAHNGHLFYLLFECAQQRTEVLKRLNDEGIGAVFHYIPLHNTAFGRTVSRVSGDLAKTDRISSRLIRLPIWVGLKIDSGYLARLHLAIKSTG